MKNEQIFKIIEKEKIEFVSKIKDENTREVKGLKIYTRKGKIFKVGKGFLDAYDVYLKVDKHSGKANEWEIKQKIKKVEEEKAKKRVKKK